MTAEMDIRLHVLEKITNNFSPDFKIGTGGYGDVYKGVLCDGELIAVKLLHDTVEGLDEQLFKNEVGNLLMLDHPNIVRFLGYCYETRSKYVEHNGENVFGKHICRVLCFEYLQDGSLDKHLPEKSFAPNWSTRYNIIKGICEGLSFLHGHENPIFHLDLKPGNILLDSFMVPKLADFGLSRLISESHTHVTQKRIGTDKYMPPEYRNGGKISNKNDVFGLGVVMIEIMAGPDGYSLFQEMHDITQFKEEVLTKWSDMIEPTLEYRSHKIRQVEMCIDTAMNCVDSQREKRPTIACILETLNKTETGIPSRQSAVVPPWSTIDLKNSLAKTVKMLTTDMDNISNLVDNMEQVPDIREASSNVEESLIIGRNEEKKKILSILSNSHTNEMVILPIYGIGGIGKTTLAKLVFDDTQFTRYSRVWVYVSKTLDLNKIGNSIISLLTNKVSDIANDQMLNNQLAMLLARRSVLIVLDDLWENDARKLDELKAMLRLGQGRKVIIVTTRDKAIARNICNTVKNVPYKLDILTDDLCWTIIKQKSCFEERHAKTHSEQIGRDIAIKCGGVALAAQSLGYMLRDMTSDQWESVRDSDIWHLSTSEDPSLRIHEVLASLRLSYSHMHQWLQSCFSYCAIFGKGRNIAKHVLIHQWIALEFTEPSKIFDSVQLCEQYITHLLGLSFLQYSMERSNERPDEYAILFTMHDLVHDLATATLADKVNKNGNDVGSNCQYALVRDPSKPLHSFVSSPENLKALHILGRHWPIEFNDGEISAAKCLHVLDFRGCGILKLPDSIGQLKQLRYLNAPWIQDQMIPSCITELSKLNYLSLRGSHIKGLPDSIGDVKGLMHLDLSGCYQLSELPVSFADLKQLVHMNLQDCFVPISDSWGGFTKLQYLNLSRSMMAGDFCDVKSLAEVIRKLTKLQYLNLARLQLSQDFEVLSEVLGKLTKLRYLNLAVCMNRMLEADIQGLLVGISNIYNLEHLDLSDNKELESIPESIGNLTKLQTLDLTGCNIQKVPASMAKMASLKIVSMKTLDSCGSNLSLLAAVNPEKLKIRKLEDVKSLDDVEGMKLIEKLRMLDLALEWTVYCGKRFVDDKDALEKLVPPNSIQRLDITGYRSPSFPTNWLMGIGRYLPDISEIHLKDLPNCNNLPPLRQLPNLRILSLHCLGGLEELNTADSCGELMFPNLRGLYIEDCPRLRIKPPLGQLPRLHTLNLHRLDSLEEFNTADSCGELMFPNLHGLYIEGCPRLRIKPPQLGQLPRLHTLSLHRLDSLEELNTEDSCGEFMFPNLHGLYIEDCPRLRIIPPLGQLPYLHTLSLHRLDSLEEFKTAEDDWIDRFDELYAAYSWYIPFLHTLDIISCPRLRLKPCLPTPWGVLKLYIDASDNILTSWGERVSQTSASSNAYPSIELEVVRSKAPLHQWTLLQHVSDIRNLVIRDCSDLTSCLPEISQCLSSLRSLELEDDILKELPAWLVELTSLKRLSITLPKLEKLNYITRQLTRGLESLSLNKCRSMTSLPQWLGELTSLEELKITKCEGIRSLPGSIRQLTQLRHIWFDSYHMHFYGITNNMLLSIPADTDVVDIQEFVEEYKRVDIALSIESDSAAKNLSDSRTDAVNTCTPENRTHKRRFGAEGSADPVLVEASGPTKRRTLQLFPDGFAATTNRPDTPSGSGINSNAAASEALIIQAADVAATDVEDLVAATRLKL